MPRPTEQHPIPDHPFIAPDGLNNLRRLIGQRQEAIDMVEALASGVTTGNPIADYARLASTDFNEEEADEIRFEYEKLEYVLKANEGEEILIIRDGSSGSTHERPTQLYYGVIQDGRLNLEIVDDKFEVISYRGKEEASREKFSSPIPLLTINTGIHVVLEQPSSEIEEDASSLPLHPEVRSILVGDQVRRWGDVMWNRPILHKLRSAYQDGLQQLDNSGAS